MSYEFEWFGNNRHICDVLEDMRKCEKTKNYSMLAGLIEEIQIMAQRMEDALRDQKDLNKLAAETAKARKAYKALQRKYKALESQIQDLEPEELKKSK